MTRTQLTGLKRIIRTENKRRAADASKVKNCTWSRSERALLNAFLKSRTPITIEVKS